MNPDTFALQNILVGTDFTPSSSAAEEMALGLAKKHGATLSFLHVVETVPFEDASDPGIAGFYATLTHEAEGKLDTIATRCALDNIPCRVRVEVGSRWQTIGAVANEIEAGLIVLGARSEPRDRAVATTGHKVFITAERPVLFVPE